MLVPMGKIIEHQLTAEIATKTVTFQRNILISVYVEWGYLWCADLVPWLADEMSIVESDRAIPSSRRFSFAQFNTLADVGVPIWEY